MTAITIENLVKAYGSVKALDGLTLGVEQGSVFGFLGPNGAGKTTTLRILAGLARANAGNIWIQDKPLEWGDMQARQIIGYLPEEPAFYPWMTPRDFLDHIGRIFGLSKMEYKKRTEELLELTGLKEVAKRRVGGFSRGMRQRLGLAQALVNRPEILLLDEPVSALDPAGRRDVLELIEQLAATCTVLMSTHILADVERVCDTVGIINKGRLVTQAKREELLERYAIPALEIETGNGSSGTAAVWIEKLRGIAVIQGMEKNGQTLRIAAQNVEVARKEIMRVAVDNDLKFERFEVVKPTLEDIFMRLVNGEEVQK